LHALEVPQSMFTLTTKYTCGWAHLCNLRLELVFVFSLHFCQGLSAVCTDDFGDDFILCQFPLIKLYTAQRVKRDL
jgi:hypothetical protein